MSCYCYYCHKKLLGYKHHVVLTDGRVVPVCADDRTCQPGGFKGYGKKPKAKHEKKDKHLRKEKGKHE